MQNNKNPKTYRGFLRNMHLINKSELLMQNYDSLINKFLSGAISKEERALLDSWVFENDANKEYFKNQIKAYSKNVSIDFDSVYPYQKFTKNIASKKAKVIVIRNVMKYAAAVILLLAIGLFVAKNQWDQKPIEDKVVDIQENNKNLDKNEIILTLPDGTSKVISTNGEEIVLDEKGKVLANRSNASMSFNNEESSLDQIVYNQIYIPFGETFKLQLSDGTQVWLNAGSKLKFPQNFTEAVDHRTVYLEGEAFFDVTTNKTKPFIVNADGVDIKVYGTQFNISSYNTDKNVAATLVEGSISMYQTNSPDQELKITPSHQATFNKTEKKLTNAKVDTDMYTDWMRNKLVINNLTFDEILTKLERRNNVQFINKAENLKDAAYIGEFADENIELILQTISLSTPFEYSFNQNEITITQK